MVKKIYGKVWNEEAPLTIRFKGDKAKSKFIVFKKVLFLNPNVAGETCVWHFLDGYFSMKRGVLRSEIT